LTSKRLKVEISRLRRLLWNPAVHDQALDPQGWESFKDSGFSIGKSNLGQGLDGTAHPIIQSWAVRDLGNTIKSPTERIAFDGEVSKIPPMTG
tara:strand:+ start:306 stop:584 length:279 start_codon:yes stop_codon:yes gene_type:complete